jgi:hypothetical protein
VITDDVQRCPLCKGVMTYPVLHERLEVCIDCHDDLSGRARGATRKRWAQEEAATTRRLRGQRPRRAS